MNWQPVPYDEKVRGISWLRLQGLPVKEVFHHSFISKCEPHTDLGLPLSSTVTAGFCFCSFGKSRSPVSLLDNTNSSLACSINTAPREVPKDYFLWHSRIIDVKDVYLVIVSHICSFASPVISFEFPSPHSLEIKKHTYKELQHYYQKS